MPFIKKKKKKFKDTTKYEKRKDANQEQESWYSCIKVDSK